VKLLFVHGAGSSGAIWHLQLHEFRDADALNLPGHPQGGGRRSIADYADFVQDYISQKKIENPMVVGHSMGGAIAMELAIRGVGLGALGLVGTGAKLRVNPDIISKLKQDYREACEMLAKWFVSPSAEPHIIDQIANDMQRIPQDVTLGDFLACDRFDRMNDVEKIKCRTIILCGQQDLLTPPKYSNYLHERIHGSRLVIVPGAGHAVMIEKYAAFNEALAAFYGSL